MSGAVNCEREESIAKITPQRRALAMASGIVEAYKLSPIDARHLISVVEEMISYASAEAEPLKKTIAALEESLENVRHHSKSLARDNARVRDALAERKNPGDLLSAEAFKNWRVEDSLREALASAGIPWQSARWADVVKHVAGLKILKRPGVGRVALQSVTLSLASRGLRFAK